MSSGWVPWPPGGQDTTGPQVTPYCNDEDMLNQLQADFPLLAPPTMIFGAGSDGVILHAAPWDLASASNDFLAQGVVPGCVVSLTDTANFPLGSLFAVDSVIDAHTLRLRRPYMASGAGLPINPSATVDDINISFLIPSLIGFINEAAYRINQEFRIDASLVFAGYAYLRFPRELRQLNVYLAAALAYQSEERASAAGRDDFGDKAKSYLAQYEKSAGSVDLDWLNSPDRSGLYGARVER